MPEVKGPQRIELSSSDAADNPMRGEPQTFYRYEGKGGKVVIVDSLSKLPPEAREHAERLDLGAAKPVPLKATEANAEPVATEGVLGALLNTAPSAPAPGSVTQPAPRPATQTEPSASKHGSSFEFDASSFGLGLGAGLLLALGLVFVGGRGEAGGILQRWIVRSALCVGVVLLGTSAYLGWSRQHAGLGSAALATPQDLIRDAKGAVDQVRQRRLEQEKQLEELERLTK